MGLLGKLFGRGTSGKSEIRPTNDNERTCLNCQQSLSGGELTDRWEDGGNAEAYVICPHCRYKNIMYGYGGDDD